VKRDEAEKIMPTFMISRSFLYGVFKVFFVFFLISLFST